MEEIVKEMVLENVDPKQALESVKEFAKLTAYLSDNKFTVIKPATVADAVAAWASYP